MERIVDCGVINTIMTKILLLITLLPVITVVIFVIGWFMRNETYKRNWIKTYGAITNTFPTGFSFYGIPQIEIMIKYKIDGRIYEGCATLLTQRNYYFPLGIIVPIMVNPKDLLDCRIIS